MLTVLRSYLAQMPGEVEKQVNLLRLGEIVIECELPGGKGIADAVKAIVAESDTIFPDPAHRGMYVQSLTLLSNCLSHHAAPFA